MVALRAVVVLGFLVATHAALAQFGIYGELGGERDGVVTQSRVFSGTLGVDYEFKFGPLRVGADVRVMGCCHGSTDGIRSYLAGPRVAFRAPIVRLKPYVEGLVGAGRVPGSADTTTGVEYQGVVGTDYTFLPHLDWRIAEYSYGGYSGVTGSTGGFGAGTSHPNTISSGIVVRLP